eukprot:4428776-Pleurochrysis_carterae.AAC.1
MRADACAPVVELSEREVWVAHARGDRSQLAHVLLRFEHLGVLQILPNALPRANPAHARSCLRQYTAGPWRRGTRTARANAVAP